jgi:peptide deformylase
MKKIVQKDADVLREKAAPVPVSEIATLKIKKILAEMKTALDSQDDGVALAAPQIGYSMRVFIVSEKVARIIKERRSKRKRGSNDQNPEQTETVDDTLVSLEHTIFINPVIKKLSREKMFVEEGCLSVRWLYGEVRRSSKTTVEAYDENGKKFTAGASGLLAQIFQHEIDHLNGVLFTDKARKLEEMKPEQQS